MPRPTPPPEQALRAHAAIKRRAAEKRERQAVQLRREADALDERWFAWRAQVAAKRNVEKASA